MVQYIPAADGVISSSGKTSATGYIIASCLAKLARLEEWRPLFTEEMNLLNTAFAHHAKDSLVKQCIEALPPKAAIWVMDTFFVPGLMQYYIFRKRFIEQRVIAAIGQGVTQVINLGAGFDTLALRTAKKYPSVHFFEVDRSYTQELKLQVLKRIEYDVAPNCHFLAADLAQTALQDVLSTENGINSKSPTLVILEGVLMYLAEAEVRALFAGLRRIFQMPLTIIFGATVTSSADGHRSMRAINSMLKRGNEGAKWSCPSQDMEKFVSEQGYTLKEWVAYKKLQSLYRADSDITNLPDENENYYVIESRNDLM